MVLPKDSEANCWHAGAHLVEMNAFVGRTPCMLISLPARGTSFECSAEVSWESVSLYTAESSQIGNISVYACEGREKSVLTAELPWLECYVWWFRFSHGYNVFFTYVRAQNKVSGVTSFISFQVALWSQSPASCQIHQKLLVICT